MEYREEKSFVIELHLSATFSESYEGEEDGYAWLADFQEKLLPRLVSGVFSALRGEPRWQVRPTTRGRNPADAIEVEVEYLPEES